MDRFLILCTTLIVVLLASLHGVQSACGTDEVPVSYGSFSYCVKKFGSGPVSHFEAVKMCVDNGHTAIIPVSRPILKVLADAAKALGIQAEEEGPGFWAPFMRDVAAPYNPSEDYMSVRSDMSRYKYVTIANGQISFTGFECPSGMWRLGDPAVGEPNQPGDKDDERDERCVALKNVDRPELGFDSYSCSTTPEQNYVMHYAICARVD